MAYRDYRDYSTSNGTDVSLEYELGWVGPRRVWHRARQVRLPLPNDVPGCLDSTSDWEKQEQEAREVWDDSNSELCNSKSGNLGRYLMQERSDQWCGLSRDS